MRPFLLNLKNISFRRVLKEGFYKILILGRIIYIKVYKHAQRPRDFQNIWGVAGDKQRNYNK